MKIGREQDPDFLITQRSFCSDKEALFSDKTSVNGVA